MGDLNQSVVVHPLTTSQYTHGDENGNVFPPVGEAFIIDDLGEFITNDAGVRLITGN